MRTARQEPRPPAGSGPREGEAPAEPPSGNGIAKEDETPSIGRGIRGMKTQRTATGNRPPNILLLIPHDLGVFLGCYGQRSVCSPRIDRLAREGVRFSHCFTTSPECTPSRGSLMTGLQPHQSGLMGLSNFGWSLQTLHLAERLRTHGYRTHQFGFQHETHGNVADLGYDRVHAVPGCNAKDVCAELSAFLRSGEAAGNPPWFAYVGFRDVHRPWCALAESRFEPCLLQLPSWLPDIPVLRKDLARFLQDIEAMDRAVGSALDTLHELGNAPGILLTPLRCRGTRLRLRRWLRRDAVGDTRVPMNCPKTALSRHRSASPCTGATRPHWIRVSRESSSTTNSDSVLLSRKSTS